MRVHAGACGCMWVHAGACGCMRVHAGACGCMAVHAGAWGCVVVQIHAKVCCMRMHESVRRVAWRGVEMGMCAEHTFTFSRWSRILDVSPLICRELSMQRRAVPCRAVPCHHGSACQCLYTPTPTPLLSSPHNTPPHSPHVPDNIAIVSSATKGVHESGLARATGMALHQIAKQKANDNNN